MPETFNKAQKKNHDQHLEFFARMISHNLRSPMAGLKMLLELYPQMPDENSRQEIMENIQQGAQQLFAMVEDLAQVVLDYKELIEPSQSLELKELAREVLEERQAEIQEAQADIQLDFRQFPEVEYRESLLKKIFGHLIDNALRYAMPARPLKLQISSYREDDRLILRFCDNGSGFKLPEDPSALFKMYKTQHRNGENGRGLGLFTVKNILEIQGGKLRVESEASKGSCFFLELYRL